MRASHGLTRAAGGAGERDNDGGSPLPGNGAAESGVGCSLLPVGERIASGNDPGSRVRARAAGLRGLCHAVRGPCPPTVNTRSKDVIIQPTFAHDRAISIGLRPVRSRSPPP